MFIVPYLYCIYSMPLQSIFSFLPIGKCKLLAVVFPSKLNVYCVIAYYWERLDLKSWTLHSLIYTSKFLECNHLIRERAEGFVIISEKILPETFFLKVIKVTFLMKKRETKADSAEGIYIMLVCCGFDLRDFILTSSGNSTEPWWALG